MLRDIPTIQEMSIKRSDNHYLDIVTLFLTTAITGYIFLLQHYRRPFQTSEWRMNQGGVFQTTTI